MCNHYRVDDPERVLAFAKPWAETLGKPWEVTRSAWPGAQMPVLLRNEKTELRSGRWGVWPWYERFKPARFVVNARDDRLTESNLWKSAVKSRRCLVPMDGFYEWCGPAGGKWEVLFRFKDSRPYWVAGLWSEDPNGNEIGFALVTSSPNDLVKAVPHDRMILILGEPEAKRWLEPGELSDEERLSLCKPHPATDMVREDMPKPERKAATKKVGTRKNKSAAHDGPELPI